MLCRYRAVTKDFFFIEGCLVQVGNGIDLEAVGFQFEPYRWRPCGVTWDSSRTVVVIKLRRTSALMLKCLGEPEPGTVTGRRGPGSVRLDSNSLRPVAS